MERAAISGLLTIVIWLIQQLSLFGYSIQRKKIEFVSPEKLRFQAYITFIKAWF